MWTLALRQRLQHLRVLHMLRQTLLQLPGGDCDTDGFDMQACLNRGRPMLVEWDGREREFIDGIGLVFSNALASCVEGGQAHRKDEAAGR